MHEEKKQEALFGRTINTIETIVITPIQKIFDEITEEKDKTKGWWNCSEIKEGILIVKTPVGSHSADSVYYSSRPKRVILTGYCGSLNYDVGDIVTGATSKEDIKEIMADISFPGTQSVRIGHVNNLREQEDSGFINSMQHKGIDCIDMETHPTYQVAKNKEAEVGGLYVVTDNLIKKPFYQIRQEDVQLIQKATHDMIRILREELI